MITVVKYDKHWNIGHAFKILKQKRLKTLIYFFLGQCGEKKLIIEMILSYNYATTEIKKVWCFIDSTILQGQLYLVLQLNRCSIHF